MCGNIKFQSNAPMLNYYQKSLNSCCFSSLVSSFASIRQTKTDNTISMNTEEILKSEVVNRMLTTQCDMFTYVFHNVIRAHLYIFPQSIIHYWFALNVFIFQNSICKINTITHFILLGFFNTQ